MLALTEPRRQKPIVRCPRAKHLRQRRDLDRVAERRPGAVRLDVADRCAARHPRQRLRRRDHLGLAVDARRGVAGLGGAVVVDRRAADHRVDRVAVGERVRQPLQHHDPRAVAGDACPRRARRTAGSARRARGSSPPGRGSRRCGKCSDDAAGQRHVALAALQARQAMSHGHQRGRAGRLDGRCSARAGPACRTPACRGSPCRCRSSAGSRRPPRPALGLRQDVAKQVGVHARAGVDADRARRCRRAHSPRARAPPRRTRGTAAAAGR